VTALADLLRAEISQALHRAGRPLAREGGPVRPGGLPGLPRHAVHLASAGVVAHFCCAATTHLRARFLTGAFWVNCLGMLGLSSAVVVGTLLIPA
jgi:hypothetical protein